MKYLAHKRGLTLIELLVVMGIISLVAAIAVPVFIRYSAMNSGDIQRAARNLQEIIKAAKIYATTYTTDAAVVYTVREETDSLTGDLTRYIDGYAVARKLTRDEAAFLGRSPDDFTPIADNEGQFRRMQEPMALALMGPVGPATSNAMDLYSDQGFGARQDMGLTAVTVVDAGGNLITPRLGQSGTLGFPAGADSFPAHRFNKTGNLETLSGKQRFTLTVTPSPSEPEDVRYVVNADGTEFTPATINLQLYATLGRVKLES